MIYSAISKFTESGQAKPVGRGVRIGILPLRGSPLSDARDAMHDKTMISMDYIDKIVIYMDAMVKVMISMHSMDNIRFSMNKLMISLETIMISMVSMDRSRMSMDTSMISMHKLMISIDQSHDVYGLYGQDE